MNRILYAADCLDVLKGEEELPSESIDLIYLDPPFNSNSNYNLPFKGRDKSLKPVEAFKDTWEWTADDNGRLAKMEADPRTRSLAAIVKFAQEVEGARSGRRGKKPSLAAYLINMSLRLLAMRRVLKKTGSIYLHCDPTASHYLKLVMDAVFGKKNFRNEIVWQRTNRGHKGSQFPPRYYRTNTDNLFFYSKTDVYSFHIDRVLLPYEDGYEEKTYKYMDSKGKYARSSPFNRRNASPRPNLCYEYNGFSAPWPSGWTVSLDTLKRMEDEGDIEYVDGSIYRKVRSRGGKRSSNLWLFNEIGGTLGKERLGYPTQKPLALLERIIKASSNPGDMVLDPFCGCGTTVHAAESLGRRWIGIDISPFAAGLIRERLDDNFPQLTKADIVIRGIPETIDDARALAERDKFEFEKWVCGFIGAEGMFHDPGTRGADGGVDGLLKFYRLVPKKVAKAEYAIVQVKGGRVSPDAVRALRETVDRLGVTAGVLVCFERYMRTVENQRSRDTFDDLFGSYPVIQGYSIENLLANAPLDLPTYGRKRQGALLNL